MPRFTISSHTGAKDGNHFDFMLECGDTLRTWRIAVADFRVPQPAVAIPDHRKFYLDYEGEVSDGRGRVAIWDTGAYETDSWENERIQVLLSGRRVRARLLLRHPAPGPKWTLEEAPHAP